MSMSLRGSHKCVERSLESNCPICHCYMFTSTTPVMFLKCSHCMHVRCYEQYARTSYICPVCCKSMGDMDDYFRRIDAVVQQQRMPPEYACVRSHILCSDCEARSVVPFHFLTTNAPAAAPTTLRSLHMRA